jgi:hypothetical protein
MPSHRKDDSVVDRHDAGHLTKLSSTSELGEEFRALDRAFDTPSIHHKRMVDGAILAMSRTSHRVLVSDVELHGSCTK